LRLQFPGRAMGRNHVDALLLEVVIEAVAVIGSIANEILGSRLQHVEVETKLDQAEHCGKKCHCAPVFRIQNTASKTALVGTGVRPGRLSRMCSSGKCSRIRSH